MIDMLALRTNQLLKSQAEVKRLREALEEKGLTDIYWDGYRAALDCVEKFSIRVAPDYNMWFDHVKNETVAMLKRNLPDDNR